MRISDWSSDVCSSDLSRTDHYPVGADAAHRSGDRRRDQIAPARTPSAPAGHALEAADADLGRHTRNRLSLEQQVRSEEHTSELQSLMRISYAVFCLKKKK